MNNLKLEMKRLLGFKAASFNGTFAHEAASALHRAKIGVKQDVTQLAQQGSKSAA
ncbi:MAG: hypothetical protein ACREEP_12905 [Dongiaceae bacterium]